jgi:putative tricarboxylic transport membrane protein
MIGAYAIRGRYLDLVLVVIFGVVGYALKQNGYPTGPVILGMILGPMIDSNFRRAALSAGSLIGVLVEIFTNPISLVLFTAIGLLLISGIRLGKRL